MNFLCQYPSRIFRVSGFNGKFLAVGNLFKIITLRNQSTASVLDIYPPHSAYKRPKYTGAVKATCGRITSQKVVYRKQRNHRPMVIEPKGEEYSNLVRNIASVDVRICSLMEDHSAATSLWAQFNTPKMRQLNPKFTTSFLENPNTSEPPYVKIVLTDGEVFEFADFRKVDKKSFWEELWIKLYNIHDIYDEAQDEPGKEMLEEE